MRGYRIGWLCFPWSIEGWEGDLIEVYNIVRGIERGVNKKPFPTIEVAIGLR